MGAKVFVVSIVKALKGMAGGLGGYVKFLSCERGRTVLGFNMHRLWKEMASSFEEWTVNSINGKA